MEKDADGFYTGPGSPPAAATAAPKAVAEAPTPAPGKDDEKKDEEEPKAPGAHKETASELLKSSFDVEVTLADQQQDPNSPLYSVKTFEELNLHADLLSGIYAMGFTRPSKIQERALPLLLASPPSHMIGQSQSGTGKTAAFVLAMLSRVDFNINKPQALCMAPSRELARQIMSVVVAMGKFTPVQTEFAIKDGLPKGASKVTAHIIVGTPGTMTDLIRRRVIDVEEVKILVLDEADTMVGQDGMGDQTLRVKNSLPKNKNVQIVLFSATFPKHVHQFAQKFAPNANKIELRRNEITVENIKQFYMDCKDEVKKYDVLVQLYHILTIGQSIIFCERRETADKISKRMTDEGHKVASLHGAKDSAERDAIIDRFRDGKEKVLITTNVIARGIDIMQVNMVVNYDLPLMSDSRGGLKPDVETYIHRIGRTGRFGRKGLSINFVHNDKTWKQMQDIEAVTGKVITKVETDDLDVMEETLKKYLK
ncbi:ATP-dependent RNA helicase DBP5 [Stereum hirsutum FP-91666 SS1]|uniref:ATP-dependent RNA helicase DBP5 n=1 Tax=Stereum hirsutum (strain FP-91666) TaxID=721885 RepID=UPI000440C0F5|nr:ATP-dependent RNA helicase DBP5 [Stereum hirsutum FP-91666 SS1]EIM91469.1 ATP-dependent RNA helicase DBP5 [Stereum hirsutum FP-91666 SS1]